MPMRPLDTSLGKVQVADWGGDPPNREIHVALFDADGRLVKEEGWPGSVSEALLYVLGVPAPEAHAIQEQLVSEGWAP
jgi:hypothetical protein